MNMLFSKLFALSKENNHFVWKVQRQILKKKKDLQKVFKKSKADLFEEIEIQWGMAKDFCTIACFESHFPSHIEVHCVYWCLCSLMTTVTLSWTPRSCSASSSTTIRSCSCSPTQTRRATSCSGQCVPRSTCLRLCVRGSLGVRTTAVCISFHARLNICSCDKT